MVSLVSSPSDDHPDLDTLVTHQERADMVSHLDECAPCRLDLKLYLETFTSDPSPLRPPWLIGLGVGVASSPVVLGVLVALFGAFRSLDQGGPFLILLAVFGVLEAGILAALTTRMERGKEDGAWRWLLPCSLPPLLGSAAAGMGLVMVSRAMVGAEQPLVMLEAGASVALRVDWAGWILGILGMGVALGAIARKRSWRLQHVTAIPVGIAAFGGLALCVASVWLGTDGAGTFLGWLTVIGLAAMASGKPNWRIALLTVVCAGAVGRAIHIGNVIRSPLLDLTVDAIISGGWPLLATSGCMIALRKTPRPHLWDILGVLAVGVPVLAACWWQHQLWQAARSLGGLG